MTESFERDKTKKKELEMKVKALEKEREELMADIKALKGMFDSI
jgi:hypothetical protein